jgi:uncharacterized protein (TIGR02246 family)
MNRLISIPSLAVMGMVALGATPSLADNGADEDAIRKVIVAMTEGFNRHDGGAASTMYLADATLVTVRGEVMHGQAAIERGLNAIFATRAKAASHRTLDVAIRFLRPDLALAHVTNELSGLVAPDGQPLPSHQELSLRVFINDGDGWKVAAFHNTMIRPFATAPR